QASGAERGYLVLRDGVPVLHRMDNEEVRVSRTLVARAMNEGRPIVASDNDLSTIDSVMTQKVRSVLVLPPKTSGGPVSPHHRRESDVFDSVENLVRYAAALDRALARRPYGELVGKSSAMVELLRTLERVAEAPYPVLIVGESGSGKELVARALHRRGPYVA